MECYLINYYEKNVFGICIKDGSAVFPEEDDIFQFFQNLNFYSFTATYMVLKKSSSGFDLPLHRSHVGSPLLVCRCHKSVLQCMSFRTICHKLCLLCLDMFSSNLHWTSSSALRGLSFCDKQKNEHRGNYYPGTDVQLLLCNFLNPRLPIEKLSCQSFFVSKDRVRSCRNMQKTEEIRLTFLTKISTRYTKNKPFCEGGKSCTFLRIF